MDQWGMCRASGFFVNHVSSVCSIMCTWCATCRGQDLDRANVELDEGNHFFPEQDAQSDVIDDLGDEVERDDEARRHARAEPGDSSPVPSGLVAVVAVEPVDIPPPPPPPSPPLEAESLVHDRRPRRNWNRIDHPNGFGGICVLARRLVKSTMISEQFATATDVLSPNMATSLVSPEADR